MKKILFIILSTIVLSLLAFAASAEHADAKYIRGYYRKNGTYIQPHYRSDSNALKYDNYSYKIGEGLFNKSYSYPTRKYSLDWYTPSYLTQPDYYYGLNSYKTKNYGLGLGSYYSSSLLDWDY